MLDRYKSNNSDYDLNDCFLHDYYNWIDYRKFSRSEEINYIKKSKLSFYDYVSDEEKELYLKYYKEMFPNVIINDEKSLNSAIENSQKYRDEFIRNNQRLILKIAFGYVKNCYFLSFMDLVNEGNIGMLLALQKFDVESGNKFSTYAVFWIKRYMGEEKIKSDKAIRVPAKMYRDLKVLKRVEGELYNKLQRFPTAEELANYSGFSLERTNKLLDYFINKAKLQSLDKPVDEDGDDLIGNYVESNEDDFTIQLHNKLFFDDCFDYLEKKLSSTHLTILMMHYGFSDGINYSYAKIAEELGMSYSEVKKHDDENIKLLRRKSLFYDKRGL